MGTPPGAMSPGRRDAVGRQGRADVGIGPSRSGTESPRASRALRVPRPFPGLQWGGWGGHAVGWPACHGDETGREPGAGEPLTEQGAAPHALTVLQGLLPVCRAREPRGLWHLPQAQQTPLPHPPSVAHSDECHGTETRGKRRPAPRHRSPGSLTRRQPEALVGVARGGEGACTLPDRLPALGASAGTGQPRGNPRNLPAPRLQQQTLTWLFAKPQLFLGKQNALLWPLDCSGAEANPDGAGRENRSCGWSRCLPLLPRPARKPRPAIFPACWKCP